MKVFVVLGFNLWLCLTDVRIPQGSPPKLTKIEVSRIFLGLVDRSDVYVSVYTLYYPNVSMEPGRGDKFNLISKSLVIQVRISVTTIYFPHSGRRADSCYSWIVLAAAALTNLLTMGFIFGSIGLLTAEYNKQFNVDVRSSSWIGSVLTGVLLCSGPLAAYLIGKFGCRLVAAFAVTAHIAGFAVSAFAKSFWHVILSYSILSGFSSSCCHVATMKILTLRFDKYQDLAYAVSAVGTDLGSVSYPFIGKWIFDALSYKYGVLALTATLVPVLPSVFLYTEHVTIETGPKERYEEDPVTSDENLSLNATTKHHSKESIELNDVIDQSKGSRTSSECQSPKQTLGDHLRLLIKPAIAVLLINTFLWNSGGSTMAVLAYQYYLDIGLTEEKASTGMTCYGLGALFGSVSLSIFSVRLRFNRLYAHWMLNLVLSIFLVIFPLVKNDIVMATFLAVFGFSYGTLCANLGSLTEHVNGSKLLYLVYAYEMAAGGLGSFIGPIASANLQKLYSNELGFFFGGGCCLAALMLMVGYGIVERDFLKPADSKMNTSSAPGKTDPVVKSTLSLAAISQPLTI